MPSQVDIYNRALSRLGVRRVTDIDEESAAARACNAAWDMVRDEVLRAHPWNFATARASLAADSDEPEFEYDYQYTLPAGCLRVLEADTDDWPWVVEGRRILTDTTAPLDIRYIDRVEDTEQYDAGFVSAVSQRLAAEISQELISASGAQQDNLMNVYRRILKQATSTDAMESSPLEFEEDVWVTCRL